jgi:hypothetical protein
VTHVLGVAAFEFGHPMAIQILVEADDPPSHSSPGEILVRASN